MEHIYPLQNYQYSDAAITEYERAQMDNASENC